MAEYTTRPAVAADALLVAQRLRAADRAELAAAGVADAETAITNGIARSALTWATEADGRVLCVGGVAPLRPHLLFEDIGVPWMLGVEELFHHRRPLVTMPPAYIRQMLDRYAELVNFVHAENHQSVRWLRRMGFTVHPAAVYGPHGALFHKFTMSRHV